MTASWIIQLSMDYENEIQFHDHHGAQYLELAVIEITV